MQSVVGIVIFSMCNKYFYAFKLTITILRVGVKKN